MQATRSTGGDRCDDALGAQQPSSPEMWVAAMPVAAVTATQLVKSAPYSFRRLAMILWGGASVQR